MWQHLVALFARGDLAVSIVGFQPLEGGRHQLVFGLLCVMWVAALRSLLMPVV